MIRALLLLAISFSIHAEPVMYIVQPNDNLTSVAQRFKTKGVSTYKLTAAIYRKNPDAFISGNINKLMAGATLTIPDHNEIEELSGQPFKQKTGTHPQKPKSSNLVSEIESLQRDVLIAIGDIDASKKTLYEHILSSNNHDSGEQP